MVPIHRGQIAAVVGLLISSSGAAGAALINFSTTTEITSSSRPTEIAVGDTFTFSLTYDDSVTDADSSTSNGSFSNALTAFSLSRAPSNSGTWDPAVGTFTLPGLILTGPLPVSPFSASLTFDIRGTGFPTIDGNAFFAAVRVPLPVNDTGGGQTVRDQIGGDLPAGSSGFLFFQEGTAVGTFNNTTAVPEPSSMVLMSLMTGFSLAAYGAHLSRKRQQVP